MGHVTVHENGQIALLRRPVPGTSFHDGIGPWPYLWIHGSADIDALSDGFRDLVTVTVVGQPGFVPTVPRNGHVRFLKEHYVYDPGLPTPALSRRARRRLSRAEATGVFDRITDCAGQMEIVGLYDRLKQRRALTGGFFDLPKAHFTSISSLSSATFFRVKDEYGIGAIACGVEFGDILQILHMAISEYGLAWNASYLLMSCLQHYVRERNLRLLTGGLPLGATVGLRIFKERWANATLPVYMLCIINDVSKYHKFSRDNGAAASSFFPAYRDCFGSDEYT